MINKFVNVITSLQLTVICLSMAMVLVFVGTLAQVNLGLYMAQEKYFQSLLVYWSPAGSDFKLPVWPGGYMLGGVLLLNLLAAHIKRFRYTKKKAGILMIHGGLIFLFVGQFLTELLQVESHMRLEEGTSKNYSESDRKSELVVIDATDPEYDLVIPVHEYKLGKGKEIALPEVPFTLRIKEWFPNSMLDNRAPDSTAPILADQGLGPRVEVTPMPPATAMNHRNVPTAAVEVLTPKGSLGTWLVSNFLHDTQTFTYDGREYRIAMRWIRYYKPFSIHLIEFNHDRYKGTEVAKNFSSHVRLTRPETGEDREILIYMNNPLRYWGETYYQASFEPGDTVSILQVVRNPAWLTPYFSVTVIGLGMTIQFLSHLVGFIKRRKA